MTSLRNLPSVEHLLQTTVAADLIASYGRPLTIQAIRSTLEHIRLLVTRGSQITLPNQEGILSAVSDMLYDWTRPTLVPVINATGVILHTNLGRAPLSSAAITAVDAVSRGYATLEFDLTTGKRGSRLVHAEGLLRRLTGAEDAVVVNNNAAAVLLILSALAHRKPVLISRTQLVEIGGGFRIPDVMKQSGARLIEVGTTNKVRLEDYETVLQALTPIPNPPGENAIYSFPGLVMHAHRSNFKIIGFTEEPGKEDLVAMAHRYGVPFVDDLGSGALLDTSRYGMAHEPTVQESLAAGADIVCFSGDKLLGGPQAGIIIGRRDLLTRIKKHPLARALRADKLCLAALTVTLLHYIKDEAEGEIPIWRMISLPPEAVRRTAREWARQLGYGEVMESESTVGGGSLPGETLPTYVLSLQVRNATRFMERLRLSQPPVIARTEGDRILLDPRTVLPEQEGALIVNLMNAGIKPSRAKRG